ncbi:MAG: sulfatase [Bacteroidetes bacterium]|nr:sulfatase [Bacteroidota bacterium]
MILIFALSISCAQKEKSQSKSTELSMSKPNILFIAIDDMNDWVGVLGGHPQAKTPNIDKLAGEGVLFTNAHTPAPACSPCRNALLYGMQPHNSGLYPFYDRPKMNPEFFEKHKSLMEIFKANGYNTFGAGKIHHGNMSKESIEMFDSREFTESINTKLNELPDPVVDSTQGAGSKKFGKMCARPSLSPLENHIDYNISLFGVDVLKRKHDQPFFLAVGFIKPHLPFVAPKKYFDMFPREEIQKNPIKEDDLADLPWAARSNAKLNDDYRNRTKDTWEDWIRAYLACNAYTDENVGRVVDALNNSEYKDNTIIVLWSDHGYHFGEKRSHRKFSLWEEATRVPFIILDPRNTKSNGKACDAPVSLIDIYPTLLSYAGIEKPDYSDGLDLMELLKNPESGRENPTLTTWGRGNYSLRSSKWRYTVYFDGSEELYDHENDPNEWDNLAEQQQFVQIKNELKKYFPTSETPLVLQGKALHNVVDADQPSLEKFKKMWNKMQEQGMNLE